MGIAWGQLAGATAAGITAGKAQRAQNDLADQQRKQATQMALMRFALDQRKEQDEATRKDAELAGKGIIKGQAPTSSLSFDMPDVGVQGAKLTGVDASRYTPAGDYYVDQQRTPEAIAERSQGRQFTQQKELAGINNTAADRRAAAGNDAAAARQREQARAMIEAARVRAQQGGSGKTFADEAKLSGEYNHTYPVESADKFASNAANALLGVQLARKGNREGHLMAITGFLRQTHPDAVVRTNDKGMLEEVQGVPADVQMTVRKWMGQGGMLTPQALNEIEHATHTMIDGQRATLAPVQAFYGQRAREAGADSAHVTRDPFAGIDNAASAGNASPAAGGKPSRDERIQQLKAKGISKDAGLLILRREGYQ